MVRVGEHVVKGTCHTCHDATGPDVDAAGIAAGEIPPLASFPRKFSIMQVMHKVREGRRISIGLVSAGDHGRMPVFSYLTPAEVKAAYIYLALYPPVEK
jgi:mono/diheme cytochrome c family protein